jgi:hypothetical protein
MPPGVEGKVSQAVRATGIRRSRSRGQAKTGLAHVFSAGAINLHGMDAYLTGRLRVPIIASGQVGRRVRTHGESRRVGHFGGRPAGGVGRVR